ncbi:CMRF35-like molecule 7 [Patagioenas fasciata]|uniref:CMRF35-like molecule 7 n=1 Tax=Patagioenas fasciata TaxID=372321 RepID=UPI003A98CECB
MVHEEPADSPAVAAWAVGGQAGAQARGKLRSIRTMGQGSFSGLPRATQTSSSARNSGGWAVTGPTEVTAKQGGLLAVSCSYESGYELYPKYWCRPGFLWICFTYIAQTNGSEVTVTQDRVSIEDKHTEHSFTVTLDNVSLGDAGWYSCGVRRRLWFNLQHSTEVTVSTDLPTTTEGSNVSPLGTNRLCAKDCEESPALSQLSITPLLLFLSVKAAVALALVCQVVWVRSRHRSHDKENVEVGSSTRAPGCPPIPEPQGHPLVSLPPILPGLRHLPRLPHTGRCSALGASPPVKPQLLLAAPMLERGGFRAQGACAC